MDNVGTRDVFFEYSILRHSIIHSRFLATLFRQGNLFTRRQFSEENPTTYSQQANNYAGISLRGFLRENGGAIHFSWGYYYVRWANKVERVFTLKYFLEDIFRLFRTEIFDMYLM